MMKKIIVHYIELSYFDPNTPAYASIPVLHATALKTSEPFMTSGAIYEKFQVLAVAQITIPETDLVGASIVSDLYLWSYLENLPHDFQRECSAFLEENPLHTGSSPWDKFIKSYLKDHEKLTLSASREFHYNEEDL